MPNAERRTLRPRAAMAPALLLLLLVLPAVAQAAGDAVKISNFWVENVQVQTIAGGHIVFTTSTGSEVQQPLEKLQGMRLERHPQLAEAEAAIEAGNPDEAVEPLQRVRDAARQDWVKHYVNWRLVAAAAAAGQPVAAAQAYAALVQARADDYFLQDPPVEVVAAATNAQKQQIRQALQPLTRRASETARPLVQQLLEAAQPTEAPAAPTDGQAPAAPAAGRPTPVTEGRAPAPAADGDAEPAVLLPADIDNDTVTQLLRQGQFQQALEAVEPTLASSGGLSRGLYQKGMAQVGLGEQTGDLRHYKDAGLNFMRVLVYFPRSRYSGAALAELGYVHAKLGRYDKARELYDRARLSLSEEDDPDYHQRLMDLIAQLP